ncbi:MAG: hypothetical protein NT049_00125, partial [Planctomycetota bacterium]|nr:hypothetical protein [Planctomycetota bacterium]
MKMISNTIALALAGLLAGGFATAAATAQAQKQPGRQTPDSVVAIVADAQGLPSVPSDQRPFFGTFWEVRSSLPCMTAPLPCPPIDPNTPVYAIGGDQFLVDETAGELLAPQAQYSRRTLSTMDSASILQAQVSELQNFVAQVQARLASALLRGSGQMSALDGPPPPGDGGGTNEWQGGITLNAYQYTTNDLWLEIVS